MSIPRFYYCTVAGIIIATLIAFCFGASGLSSYNHLKKHERYLLSSIIEMEDQNRALEQQLTLLKVEPEMVRLLSRETGYYRENEMVLNLISDQNTLRKLDHSPISKELSVVGPLISQGLPASRDSFNVVAVGLLIGAGLFLVITIVLTTLKKSPVDGSLPENDDSLESQFLDSAEDSRRTRPDVTSQIEGSAKFRDTDTRVDVEDENEYIKPENKMGVAPNRWPWLRRRKTQDVTVYRL